MQQAFRGPPQHVLYTLRGLVHAERCRQGPNFRIFALHGANCRAQAHRLSTADTNSSPSTTTTPDDAFYIFKVVFSRLLSTGSRTVVERTAGALRSVIESDYASTIRRKMDDVYRNAGVGRGEKVERESRATFIVRSRPHSRHNLSYAYTRGFKKCRYY